MERVWPGRIVEENALQSQISDLRAVLGADRDLIRTVSGRGFQFTGEVHRPPIIPYPGEGADIAVAPSLGVPGPTNLPEPVSELVGRDDDLREIVSLISTHRLVTVTGAGGIGKTRLALAGARQLRPQFPDGVWLVELSPVMDACLVPAKVATALELAPGADDLSPLRVGQALADRQLLLVLDTCEHIIGGAAELAEPCCVPAAGSVFSPPAASRWSWKESGSAPCRRSQFRWKMPKKRRRCASVPFGCSLSAHGRPARFRAQPAGHESNRSDLSAARRHPAGT